MVKLTQTGNFAPEASIEEIQFDKVEYVPGSVVGGSESSSEDEVPEYQSIEYLSDLLPVTYAQVVEDESAFELNAGPFVFTHSNKRRMTREDEFTQAHNELPTLDEIVGFATPILDETQPRPNKRRNLTTSVDGSVQCTSAQLPRLDVVLSSFRLRSNLMTEVYRYIFNGTILNLQNLLEGLNALPLSTIVKEVSITQKLLVSFLDSYPVDSSTLVNVCKILASYKKLLKEEVAELDQSRCLSSLSEQELKSMPVASLLIQASNAYANMLELLKEANDQVTTRVPENPSSTLEVINQLHISVPADPVPFPSMTNQNETSQSTNERLVQLYIESIETIQDLDLPNIQYPEIISMDSLFRLRWSLDSALTAISSNKASEVVNLISRLDHLINHDNALMIIAALNEVLAPIDEPSSTSSMSTRRQEF